MPRRASRAASNQEVDVPAMKERLSQLWLFALLNYLYADCDVTPRTQGSSDTCGKDDVG